MLDPEFSLINTCLHSAQRSIELPPLTRELRRQSHVPDRGSSKAFLEQRTLSIELVIYVRNYYFPASSNEIPFPV